MIKKITSFLKDLKRRLKSSAMPSLFWLKNTGIMPSYSDEIAVLFRDGTTEFGFIAAKYEWRIKNNGFDIIEWFPSVVLNDINVKQPGQTLWISNTGAIPSYRDYIHIRLRNEQVIPFARTTEQKWDLSNNDKDIIEWYPSVLLS
jgi:hypothetical protein